MGPTLTALVNLQIIENQLRKARKKQKKGRQAIVKQQQHIIQLEAAVQAKHQEIKQTQLQAGDFELQLQVKDEEINKFRLALNQAKSNKDYSAILTQLNINKADKSKLEDRVLALMTQVDQEKAGCAAMEQDIEAEKQKLEQVTTKVNQRQETLITEIAALEKQHELASDDAPEKGRQLFERLAERFDGEAIVMITEINVRRGEYGCGGCFMKIPRELVNTLMSRDEIITCPSCGRMLVLDLDKSEQPTT